MFRTAVAVLTALIASATVSGASVAAASGATSHSSRHGPERFALVGTSTKSGLFSVIATGLFTDGGTVNIFASRPTIKLGAGTLRFHDVDRPGKVTFNKATCLETITGRGTYKLSHGTGKYAGISGSGRFVTVGHAVFRHKPSGTCATSRPLAFQGTITLTGSVTERG